MFVQPMKSLLFIITVLISIFGYSLMAAQPFRPVSVSLAEGLAQSSVYCIAQDDIGFTWMGTQDGLCRYDGIGFKIYREDPFDSLSISSNFITALHADARGWMWAGTQHSGVNLFVPGSSQFRHLKMENTPNFPSNNIYRIASDTHGNIWIATANGLAMLEVTNSRDVFTASVQCYTLREESFNNKAESFQIYDFALVNGNRVWVASSTGLRLYEFRNKNFRLKNHFHRKNSNLPSDRIISVVADKHGNPVFATLKSLYEIQNGMIKPVINNNIIPQGTLFQQLFISSSGYLWIGTDGNGLFRTTIFPDGTLDWQNSEKISLGNARLTGSVLSFFEDRICRNIIWTGTFAGGCIRLVPVLKNFRSDRLEYEHVTSPVVRSILKDTHDRIWIGTQEGLFIRKPGEVIPQKIFLSKDNGRLFITGIVMDLNKRL
jgi:ligand-binding sensor domain-containing protein